MRKSVVKFIPEFAWAVTFSYIYTYTQIYILLSLRKYKIIEKFCNFSDHGMPMYKIDHTTQTGWIGQWIKDNETAK